MMKKYQGWLTLLVISVFLINSCDEDEKEPVITLEVTDITASTAKSGGTVQFKGEEVIISQGVCWSINPLPTIADNTTSDALDYQFTSSITGLEAGFKYFLRAYATTHTGTTYGNEVSFTTIEYSDWKSFNISNSSLAANSIQKITVDKQGIAWIGAENYLVRFDGTSFTNFKYSENSNAISEIFVDYLNNKWISATSGLYKFNGVTFEKSARVAALYLEKDSILWMVRGGSYFDGQSLEKREISSGVSEFCTLRDKSAYYALGADLKGRKLAVEHRNFAADLEISDDSFCSLRKILANGIMGYPRFTTSPDSLVYFTTLERGLGIMYPNLTIGFVRQSNSQLPSEYIHDVAVGDGGRSVWIACDLNLSPTLIPRPDTGGLAEYSPGKGIVNIYNMSNSGIISDMVTAVGVMKNKVLVGTDKGLSVYTR